MLEESLRGEAVSMQHKFFLDGVCRLTRRHNVTPPPCLPCFSVPFIDARSHPRISYALASVIFNLGLVEQARARKDFFSDSEGSS
jgi:hypothetical protein